MINQPPVINCRPDCPSARAGTRRRQGEHRGRGTGTQTLLQHPVRCRRLLCNSSASGTEALGLGPGRGHTMISLRQHIGAPFGPNCELFFSFSSVQRGASKVRSSAVHGSVTHKTGGKVSPTPAPRDGGTLPAQAGLLTAADRR